MELLRAGEALLRYPLLPILAPTAYKLPQTSQAASTNIARRCRGQQHKCRPSRHFATTRFRRQEAAAFARTPQLQEDGKPTPSQDSTFTAPPTRSTIDDDISSLLDSTLDFKKGTPTSPASRTSRFSSRNAQASNRLSPGRHTGLDAATPSSGNSVDDLINSMTSRAGGPQQRQKNRSELDISSMLDPLGSLSGLSRGSAEEEERPAMRLGPKLGRTVQVNLARNMDVGRAFRTLEMQCARNSVRKDFNKQRFHERPGLKRKRLKRERWRKNFKNQFKATVQMVQRMKQQGW